MGDFKQKILADLEPGQTVIYDGREWWFAGVFDGKALIWPKEAFDMTQEQVLALYKKLSASPNGEIPYMEFKAILDGKDLDIEPKGKPYESASLFCLSHEEQRPEVKGVPSIPSAKWWVRPPLSSTSGLWRALPGTKRPKTDFMRESWVRCSAGKPMVLLHRHRITGLILRSSRYSVYPGLGAEVLFP